MNVDGATTCVACASPLTPMPMAAPAMGMSAPAMPKARPTGVTILAVLYYIGAAVLVVLSIAAFIGGAFLGAFLGEMMASGGGGAAMGAVLGMMFGVVFLLLAALTGAAGWGMWTGKGWAWILALGLNGLSAASSLMSLIQGDWSSIIGLAIAGFIIWYLMQPGVKAWFGRT